MPIIIFFVIIHAFITHASSVMILKALISPDFGADFGTECAEDRSLYVRLSVMFMYSVETSKRIL